MRYLIISLFMAALALPSTCPGQDWTWNKMDDGKLSVLAPGNMEYQQRQIETAIGIITQHHYYFRDSTSETGNFLYHLNYYDYPAGTFPADSAELKGLMMQMIIEGSVADLAGELQYEGDLFTLGHPSKIWKVFVREGDFYVKNLLVMAGDRIVDMQVFTYSRNDKNPQVDKFLESLKMTGP